jgi:O-6-methylguanine DNA methyltransferase
MLDVDVGVERYTYEVDRWGVGELAVEGNVLLAHDLPCLDRQPAVDLAWRGPSSAQAAVPPTTPKGGASPPGVTVADDCIRVCADFVPDFVERVRRQLGGEQTSYDDVPLDLSWCTPFQADLAVALLAVPWGEIVSYGELAALAGRPGAARAAGSFCAQNRFALVMPCHRVVGATGIGGYGDPGVTLKRRLLALEGVEL